MGSTLSGKNLDLRDPIPGHCAYEDPGFWVTEDGGCKDVATGAVYSWWNLDYSGGVGMSQAEAIAWCDQLVQAGFKDWELPKKEILIASAENGAKEHLNLDHNGTYMTASSQGKKFPFVVSLRYARAYAVGPGSTDVAFCGRNLPPDKKGKGPKK